MMMLRRRGVQTICVYHKCIATATRSLEDFVHHHLLNFFSFFCFVGRCCYCVYFWFRVFVRSTNSRGNFHSIFTIRILRFSSSCLARSTRFLCIYTVFAVKWHFVRCGMRCSGLCDSSYYVECVKYHLVYYDIIEAPSNHRS